MAEKIELTKEDGQELFGTPEVTEVVETPVETPVEEKIVEAVIETPVKEGEETVVETKTEEEKVEKTEGEAPLPERKTIEFVKKPEPVEEPKKEEPVEVKLAYKSELQASLNKYLEENENGTIAEFDRLYNANHKDTKDIEMIAMGVRNDPNVQDMSRGEIQELVEAEIEKYNLGSEDESEVRRGQAQLKRDAMRVRNNLSRASEDFKEKYKAPLEYGSLNKQPEKTEEEIAAEREALAKTYGDEIAPYIEGDVIQIKDNDEFINIPVGDRQAIIDAAVDPVGFITKVISNEDGSFNYGMFANFVNFGNDMEAYNATVIKYAIAKGKAGSVAELKNATPLVTPNVEPSSDLSPNEDEAGFLKAMQSTFQKKMILKH